jgi:ribulose-5-phosphate 4-epimerase/fuculose-1-phosphate aldolase
MATELEEIKLQVAQANRVLADVGLATGVTAALGHASMRVPSQPDRFVVKGREYALDALAVMRAEDMVVCDTEGFLVDAPPGITQCSEVKIHSCIYKARPDVQSVVHVHPRFIVLMSVLRIPLVPMCQEGIHLVHYPLPVYPHVKTIQNDAEGMEVARLLGGRQRSPPPGPWSGYHRQQSGPVRHRHAPARRAGPDELPCLLRHGTGIL